MCSALDAGLVGLSITYSMTLMGMFQWGVRQSAEVENQVRDFSQVFFLKKKEKIMLFVDPLKEILCHCHG